MKFPFDKIYCLHLAEREDRHKNLLNELSVVGLFDSTNIWWTCFRPFSEIAGNSITTLKTEYYHERSMERNNVMAGVFNCALEHYTIVKQSYLRGFDNILIMEDDIKFDVDKSVLEKAISLIPNDYDLIRFWSTEYIAENLSAYNGEEDLYVKITDRGNIVSNSTLCYALSRKGMERYIKVMDDMFIPADVPFNYFNVNKLNVYRLNYKVCEPNNSFKSDI